MNFILRCDCYKCKKVVYHSANLVRRSKIGMVIIPAFHAVLERCLEDKSRLGQCRVSPSTACGAKVEFMRLQLGQVVGEQIRTRVRNFLFNQLAQGNAEMFAAIRRRL